MPGTEANESPSAEDVVITEATRIIRDRQAESRQAIEDFHDRPTVGMSAGDLDSDLADLFNTAAGNGSTQTMVILWQLLRVVNRIKESLQTIAEASEAAGLAKREA